MKNKKGVEDIVQNILMGAIAGIFFLLIFLVAFKALGAILPKTGPQAQCANSQWWDNPRGLKEIIKDIDSGKDTSAEFLFYNNNCNLVSFSFLQGINDIPYPGVQPREPALCMCEIDRSFLTGDAECKTYDCYKFKNFDQINAQQFSTEDLEPYVFLRFTRDGRTLRIDNLSTEKQPEPIVYTRPENLNILDGTGLIKRLAVIFSTRQIKAFTPIVKIKEVGFLTPQDIPNIPGLTKLFDLDLAQPPQSGQSINDYLSNHQSVDPNLVKRVLIEISLPKTSFDRLTSYQKNNIALYYKKADSWNMNLLRCTEADTEIICGAIINEFSNSFAISTARANEAYTSHSEKEIALTPFITDRAIEEGLDPLFIKSIIKIESDWNTRSVSRCGAAGIIQIMPHTARDAGLSTILDPVNSVHFDTTGSCTANEPYGAALKNYVQTINDDQQLANLDERFDDQKAIAAAIRYFLRIKNNLERRGIPATMDNMAAAYNIGPNDVTADGQYAKEKAYEYVSRFRNVYNGLQNQIANSGLRGDIHEGESQTETPIPVTQENLVYLLDDPEIKNKIPIVKYDLKELMDGGLGAGSVRDLSNINLIVLHHTGGYRATTSPDGRFPGAIQTLQSRHLSSHYVLDRDGTLHYIVPENVVAWHAGCCIYQNYDLTNKSYVKGCCNAEGSTDQPDVICKKTGCIMQGVNSRSIGIEIVNRGELNDPFTDAQYNTLSKLLPYLTQKLNIPYDDQHIIGHYEVTQMKNDPKYLEWARLNLPNHRNYEQVNQLVA